MSKNALLLIGSPRGLKSNSNSIGSFLLDRLKDKGFETETVELVKAVKSGEGTKALLCKVDEADFIVLASPLHTDQLPYPVIKAMEAIFAHRSAGKAQKKPKLLAILNNGFPEASQNRCAIDIARNFARMAGIEWYGGLQIGMGELIGQKPLESVPVAGSLKKSLGMVAEAIAKGLPLPPDAGRLASKPFAPLFLAQNLVYPHLVGPMMWNRMAKANGVRDKVYDRPYG